LRTRFYQLSTIWRNLRTRFYQLSTIWRNLRTRFYQLSTMWRNLKTRFYQLSTMWHMMMSKNRFKLISISAIFVLSVIYLLPIFQSPATSRAFSRSTNNCLVSFGEYNGPKYKSPGQTIGEGKCLVESKWMRVMQHTVNLGSDAKNLIDDWLFVDYHDRINVLVQAPHTSTMDGPHFLVFKQSKYALEGRDSLAVIGGIIEPGEDPETAARREVSEEMDGLVCDTLEFLGRYRTDVNRGIGWVNGFLAKDCESSAVGDRGDKDEHRNGADEVGKPDTERQDLVSISLGELRKNAREGKFLEVQWSNTVALALIRY